MQLIYLLAFPNTAEVRNIWSLTATLITLNSNQNFGLNCNQVGEKSPIMKN